MPVTLNIAAADASGAKDIELGTLRQSVCEKDEEKDINRSDTSAAETMTEIVQNKWYGGPGRSLNDQAQNAVRC